MPSMIPRLAVALLTAAVLGSGEQEAYFDLLIRNGIVLDGTGNPGVRADIGIRGDVIEAIGDLDTAPAQRVIDASGLHVAPGFIDMHSHADTGFVSGDIDARRAPNLVSQGITTVVFGADGRNQLWPIDEETTAYRKYGVAINVVPMVGHGTVRSRVLGDDFQRAATPDELEQMKALVRQGMEEGAWGIGAGPEYSPGIWSTPEELVELAQVIAPFDGFYYAHQRSQARLPRWQLPSMIDGPTLDGIDGLAETIDIAVQTGIRVVGSHVKAKGRSSWGRSFMDTKMIELARSQGHQVYLDHYPYETNMGGPTMVFPAWALEGGHQSLRQRLEDQRTRHLLEVDLEHMIDQSGGPGRLIITHHVDPKLVGKTVSEVAVERQSSLVETLIDFALAGTEFMPAGLRIRPLSMSEYDNDQYIRQDYTATCTDGGVRTAPGGNPGMHPRYWGAFPRKIARYVKERSVITLPFAVRSMSGLAAQIIALPDRGLVREGYAADLTIFDFDRIQDRATIMEPGLPSVGIEYVLVNGQLAIDGAIPTGTLTGKVLLRHEIRRSNVAGREATVA